MDFLLDPRLRLRDRRPEIAAAHAEFHRRVPALVLAINERRPLRLGDARELAERNLRAGRRRHEDRANGLQAAAVRRGPTHHQVEMLLAFVYLRHGHAADRRLDHVHDVADVQAVASQRLAIGHDADVRLTEGAEDAEIFHAAHCGQDARDLVRLLLVQAQIGAHHLRRVLALHAAHRLLDVVGDRLREVEVDAGEGLAQLPRQLPLQLVLRDAAPPSRRRLEGSEQLDVVEPGNVGAVVGPPELRDDGADLGNFPVRCVASAFRGTAEQDAAHAPDVPGGLLEADGERKGGADPEVSFLELRHELGADEAEQPEGGDDRRQGEQDGGDRSSQREREERPVRPIQPAKERVVVAMLGLVRTS